MTPGELSLPFNEWRDGQYELLTKLVCGDTPYTLLEAPTGLGKSGLALALGRLLDGPRIVLVGTKQLQDQYQASFSPLLLSAKGRGNFTCNIDRSKTADEAKCVVGAKCPRKGTDKCDYYQQKNAAVAADEIVLNYPYWLSLANYAHTFTEPTLLICDEAHLLEEELRRFASATLRRSAYGTLGLPFQRETMAGWRKHAAWFVARFGRDYRALSRGSDDELSPKEQKEARALKSTYEACQALQMGDAENWVLEETNWGVQFRPVWVAPLVPQLLLRHAPRILFMSATILDKDLFCKQLGLPPEDTRFVRANSTFPKDRRPIFYQPVGKIKMADPTVLPKLVDRIDAILDEHPGQHGLIHTVSYKLAQYVVDNSRHASRLVTHDNKTRAAALGVFQNTPGGVLVSPSVTTGVDLPYDACAFQIIAKLSFPDLTDRQIKQRMATGPDGLPNEKGQHWYNWATACTLVQAYGRGMRAPDDNCITYLLDGNWEWFRHVVRDMLPEWFTEAIKRMPRQDGTVSIDSLLENLRGKKSA